MLSRLGRRRQNRWGEPATARCCSIPKDRGLTIHRGRNPNNRIYLYPRIPSGRYNGLLGIHRGYFRSHLDLNRAIANPPLGRHLLRHQDVPTMNCQDPSTHPNLNLDNLACHWWRCLQLHRSHPHCLSTHHHRYLWYPC